MAEEKFTLDDALSTGWAVLLERFWQYAGLLALASFLCVLPGIAQIGLDALAHSRPALSLGLGALLGFASCLISTVMALGVINVQLRLLDGKDVSSNNLWEAMGKFFAFIGATLIFIWFVGFGMMLFIVPGIILMLMFQFYPYFLVDHKLGPIESLRASAAITSGCLWELFFLNMLLTILEGIGFFFLVIGAVFPHMLKQLTLTYVYRKLLENTPKEELPEALRQAKPAASIPEAR